MGMRAAILENELLRVLVLLDRGAEIIEFRYKPRDIDPLLRLPRGLRLLTGVVLPGATFLDYYAGGWQEILPNGGPPAIHRGAAYDQHGEVCLIPWEAEVVADTPDRVVLRCSVRAIRTPLLLERTMTLMRGSATLFLDERLTNEAREPIDCMWGHHVAFGLPFLAEGALIDTSARQLLVHEPMPGAAARRLAPGGQHPWPLAPARAGGMLDMSIIPPSAEAAGTEMAYLADFAGAPWYAITNQSQRFGFGMRWDGATFPYLWLWQEFYAGDGYPWWKGTYTVALEPWSSYPTSGLPAAIARGSQLTLAPGETRTTRLIATAYEASGRIAGIDEQGGVQQ